MCDISPSLLSRDTQNPSAPQQLDGDHRCTPSVPCLHVPVIALNGILFSEFINRRETRRATPSYFHFTHTVAFNHVHQLREHRAKKATDHAYGATHLFYVFVVHLPHQMLLIETIKIPFRPRTWEMRLPQMRNTYTRLLFGHQANMSQRSIEQWDRHIVDEGVVIAAQ